MENYQATMAEKADEHAILNSCEGGRRRRPLSLRRFFELRGLREGHSEMVLEKEAQTQVANGHHAPEVRKKDHKSQVSMLDYLHNARLRQS